MIKKIFKYLTAILSVVLFNACEGAGIGTPNLYVEYDPNPEYEILSIKFIKTGADATSGKNLIGSASKIEKEGKNYLALTIPRTGWGDVIIEAKNPKVDGGNVVCRVSANTKDYEWERLDFYTYSDIYASKWWPVHGEGEFNLDRYGKLY